MPSNPLIGIVVPIYNVESYLKECLDSILNQTYQHFVVALINDGSTDSGLNIALEYVRKDKRFILFDKTNAGLSSARNVGIDYFSGKYNFAKKDSDFIITNDNPYNISRVYGECVLDYKDSLLDSKETQYYKESQKDSSDLRPQNDENVKYDEKARHVEQSETSTWNLDSSYSFRMTGNLDSKDSSPNIIPHNQDSKDTEEYTNSSAKQIDYIIFLDSDDYWKSNCLESCVKCANGNHKVVWFNWQYLYDGVDEKEMNLTPMIERMGYTEDLIQTNIELFQRNKEKNIIGFYCSWSLFIRFEYLMEINLRFKDGIAHEDNIFNLYLFAKTDNIYIHTQALYTYRIRKSSLMNRTNNESAPPTYLAELCKVFNNNIIYTKRYYRIFSIIQIKMSYIEILKDVDERIYNVIFPSFVKLFDNNIQSFLRAMDNDPWNIMLEYIRTQEAVSIYNKKSELEKLGVNASLEIASLHLKLDRILLSQRGQQIDIYTDEVKRYEDTLEGNELALLKAKAEFTDEIFKQYTKARRAWYKGGYFRFFFVVRKMRKVFLAATKDL